MTATPATVVVNPVHARGRAAADRVVAAARALGLPSPEVVATTPERPGGPQAREAVARGARRIVVVGGDGTVRDVAGALAADAPAHGAVSRDRPVLGVVATGSGNIVARNLDVPVRDVDAAARRALTGPPEALDVGRARLDGAGPAFPFLTMAGLGNDARTVAATGSGAKARLRQGAYGLAALRTWRLPPVAAEVVVTDADGTTHHWAGSTWTVLAGLLPRVPGGITVFPGTHPGGGTLQVLLVTDTSVRGWVSTAAHGLRGAVPRPLRGTPAGSHRTDAPGPTPPASLRYRTAVRVDATVTTPQPVQLDGEVHGPVTSLAVSFAPGAVLVAGA